MKAPAYHSCIGCYRGDTTTVVSIKGEAHFIIAALHKLTGTPLDEAAAAFGVHAEENGFDPGMAPAGRVFMAVRLCSDCAAKNGTTVVEESAIASGEPVYTYAQPE